MVVLLISAQMGLSAPLLLLWLFRFTYCQSQITRDIIAVHATEEIAAVTSRPDLHCSLPMASFFYFSFFFYFLCLFSLLLLLLVGGGGYFLAIYTSVISLASAMP